MGLVLGVVLVEPHVCYWKFKTRGETPVCRSVLMARRQIPLALEAVRTVQTPQGMSMDAAMI